MTEPRPARVSAIPWEWRHDDRETPVPGMQLRTAKGKLFISEDQMIAIADALVDLYEEYQQHENTSGTNPPGIIAGNA